MASSDAGKLYVVMGAGAPITGFLKKSRLKEYLKNRKTLPATMVVYELHEGRTVYDVLPIAELIDAV